MSGPNVVNRGSTFGPTFSSKFRTHGDTLPRSLTTHSVVPSHPRVQPLQGETGPNIGGEWSVLPDPERDGTWSGTKTEPKGQVHVGRPWDLPHRPEEDVDRVRPALRYVRSPTRHR